MRIFYYCALNNNNFNCCILLRGGRFNLIFTILIANFSFAMPRVRKPFGFAHTKVILLTQCTLMHHALLAVELEILPRS